MNGEQLAALTEDWAKEAQEILDRPQRPPMPWSRWEAMAFVFLPAALTALADARLELARITEERDRYRGLLNFPDAVLEIIRTSPDYAYVVWNAASQHTLDMMCEAHASAKMEARNAKQARDQIREDIKRLLEALRHALSCRLTKCHDCQEGWSIRAELLSATRENPKGDE